MRASRTGIRLCLAAAVALPVAAAGGCYMDFDHDDHDHDDDCWQTPAVRVVDEGESSCAVIWPSYQAEAYLLKSDTEWAGFWAAHTGCWGTDPPVPAVDFAVETVVAVVLNDRPTTGYRVTIDAYCRCDSTLEIQATETAPGTGCATLPMTTRPYQIIAVAGHIDTLYFTRFDQQVVPCP